MVIMRLTRYLPEASKPETFLEKARRLFSRYTPSSISKRRTLERISTQLGSSQSASTADLFMKTARAYESGMKHAIDSGCSFEELTKLHNSYLELCIRMKPLLSKDQYEETSRILLETLLKIENPLLRDSNAFFARAGAELREASLTTAFLREGEGSSQVAYYYTNGNVYSVEISRHYFVH